MANRKGNVTNPTGKGGAKKGEPSRNPSGRSKKRLEIEELARKVAEGKPGELHALEDLGNMAQDPEVAPKDRKACWDTVLGYAYGKPTQRKEISGPDGQPLFDGSGHSVKELEQLARDYLEGKK